MGAATAQLVDIETRFTSNASILHDLLHSQALQGQTKGLDVIKQLLLRLDFNGFSQAAFSQP